MSETYPAILRGDRLEWTGEPPGPDFLGRAVSVEVAIVQDLPPHPEGSNIQRQQMFESLDRLAARQTFAGIEDPVAWQREIRQDRTLPGRDR